MDYRFSPIGLMSEKETNNMQTVSSVFCLQEVLNGASIQHLLHCNPVPFIILRNQQENRKQKSTPSFHIVSKYPRNTLSHIKLP